MSLEFKLFLKSVKVNAKKRSLQLSASVVSVLDVPKDRFIHWPCTLVYIAIIK